MYHSGLAMHFISSSFVVKKTLWCFWFLAGCWFTLTSSGWAGMHALAYTAKPVSDIIQTGQPISHTNDPLKTGLIALYSKDIRQAMALRNTLPHNSLDRHILSWAIGQSGIDGISSELLVAITSELQTWPGIAILRTNLERALYKENPPAHIVITAFANMKPQTPIGAIILARALIVTGNVVKAREILLPFWLTKTLSVDEEQLILREFSNNLTSKDHLQRMLRMLYANHIASAGRVARLAHAELLYNIFAAMAKKSPNTERQIVAAQNLWQSNPIWLFAKIQYLRRAERYAEAAALMLKAPQDPRLLMNPDAWWVERRMLSRKLLDMNKPQLAYQLVSTHTAETPTMTTEAEFHAGWYALRALNDPKIAAPHFTKQASLSSKPISISRAYYWLGRATQAAGDTHKARDYFHQAAHYGTTFYGQLSAARLGQTRLELPYPKPTNAERIRFEQREAVKAIKRLEELGYGARAAVIYRALAQELDNVGELALLAVIAERGGNHYLALQVGKIAAQRGFSVGALSHPTGAIPQKAKINESSRALVYAIARQESEFNIAAVSTAGAHGLLQLLPETARDVALRIGITYSKQRLTTDAAYNATLASRFLNEQIDRFNGSYILTLVSYNAGARRANEWIRQYGDPRKKSLDQVVDWIERIPYSETRNYVQRVIENYEVYKIRLNSKMSIEKDLTGGHF